MTRSDDLARLRSEHTREAVALRLASDKHHSYLGDGVLGAIDGTVTTFAVVIGAFGAGISSGIALVLGLANVIADGFSMAVGNYMKSRADRHVVERARALEERHIDAYPEGEREEIRQIFAAKGFEGPMLAEAVDIVTRDRRRWVDTMLVEELGVPLESPAPIRAALTTFVSFLVAGLVPLLPLFLVGGPVAFRASMLATGGTFLAIGFVKGKVTHVSALRSAFETLMVGGGAAALAYFAGSAARTLVQ